MFLFSSPFCYISFDSSWESLNKHQYILSLVIIYSDLMTSMFDQAVILLVEKLDACHYCDLEG